MGPYVQAREKFKETGRDKDRIKWQKAMADVLNAYSRATGMLEFSRDVTFDWHILLDLREAFKSVVDGKDADLFTVLPSDKYDSTMEGAICFAVRHVLDGSNESEKQKRKRWIMENYGVTRSALNSWIRTKDPGESMPNDETDWKGQLLSYYVAYYRKYKLTGRRRKL
jgi:hypothetical protein